jgi:hypothetical protein
MAEAVLGFRVQFGGSATFAGDEEDGVVAETVFAAGLIDE